MCSAIQRCLCQNVGEQPCGAGQSSTQIPAQAADGLILLGMPIAGLKPEVSRKPNSFEFHSQTEKTQAREASGISLTLRNQAAKRAITLLLSKPSSVSFP